MNDLHVWKGEGREAMYVRYWWGTFSFNRTVFQLHYLTVSQRLTFLETISKYQYLFSNLSSATKPTPNHSPDIFVKYWTFTLEYDGRKNTNMKKQ